MRDGFPRHVGSAVQATVRTHALALVSLFLSVLGLLALEGSAALEPRWALTLGVVALVAGLAATRVRRARRLEFATAVAISAATTVIAAAGLVVLATYGCRICE